MRVLFLVTVVISLACTSTEARPTSRSDLTSLAIEFLEFIPTSYLMFFGDLNDTDRSAIIELSKNISRNRLTADNETEFLKQLKEKSENAYSQVIGLQNYMKDQVENLREDSKEFMKKLSDKYISLFMTSQNAPKGTFAKLKAFAKDTFKLFDELNDEGKDDLRNSFPELTQLLANPRFRSYLRRVFDSSEVKRAFNRADRAFNPK